MANEPSQYPAPVASGGLATGFGYRTLRNPTVPLADVRQPYLGGAPRVLGMGGFGTGMGAFVRNQGSDADQSQGFVIIRCGLNPSPTSGLVQLDFTPIVLTVGQYVCFADWASIGLVVSVSTLMLTCNFNRPILSNETLGLAYQWAVSQ